MRLLVLLAALALAGGWMHLRAETPQTLHPDDPRAPQNRRITITVLTHEAEERLLGKQAPSAQQDNKLESENMEKQENSPPARQTP